MMMDDINKAKSVPNRSQSRHHGCIVKKLIGCIVKRWHHQEVNPPQLNNSNLLNWFIFGCMCAFGISTALTDTSQILVGDRERESQRDIIKESSYYRSSAKE
jgi:hypothetical protein